MRKILMSLAVIGAVASVVIGGTVAYFSDTETSTGNTLTAGSLYLEVNGQNSLQGPVVTIADMKPSQVRYSDPITLRVYNNPGKLWKHIKRATTCETNGVTEPECTEQNGIYVNGVCTGMTEDKNTLAAYTWFDLEKKVGTDASGNIIWETVIPGNIGMVDPDFTSCWIPLGTYGELGQVSEVIIRQSFHLDANVTNWAQSDKCTFEEEFMVTQTNAPDPVTSQNRVWNSTVQKCVDIEGTQYTNCTDGLDNDLDGLTDTADPGCQP